MLRGVLILLILCSCVRTLAQPSPSVVRVIPTEARLLAVDETGAAYLVRSDNNLVRYTASGDSSAFFRSILNGPIGAVDVTNPLRILVYYPGFSTIVTLDRFLAPMTEIKLTRLGISAPTVVAASADGGLWVYDPVNVRLKKFSEDGRLLQEGSDLRLELGLVPGPTYLIERDRRLALCDTAQGIFLFDRFAAPTTTLPIQGVHRVQLIGSQVVYQAGSELRLYDALSGRESTLVIPPGDGAVLSAQTLRGVLYVLYERALVLYKMPEG